MTQISSTKNEIQEKVQNSGAYPALYRKVHKENLSLRKGSPTLSLSSSYIYQKSTSSQKATSTRSNTRSTIQTCQPPYQYHHILINLLLSYYFCKRLLAKEIKRCLQLGLMKVGEQRLLTHSRNFGQKRVSLPITSAIL